MSGASFTNTPQAQDDVFTANVTGLTEDHLTIIYLTVVANDLGGNAKTLWSVDNGVNNTGAMSGYIAADLLTQDAARAEATNGDTSRNGAKIWITNDGKVGYDACTLSAAFKAQLDSLGTNHTLTDSFIYAIRLGNGTLSWATAMVQFGCSNAAVTITSAPQSGLVIEDAPLTPDPGDSLSATGTISFTDADLSDGHTASFVPAAGNTTALGTFSLDPVSEAANVANGSVQWHYALNNGAAQYLAAGQSVVEHYTVTVDDGHGSTATKVVTITITGTNDPISTPIDVDAAANTVAENAAIGTLVGVTASASDPNATDTITYSLVDNANGAFQINAGTGVVSVLDGSQINRESAASLAITVRASSSDGSHADQAFTIAVNDVDEFDASTPTDNAGATNAVNENAAAGALVGVTAHSADADATNHTITYSLVDNASGAFQINANTGVVSVLNGSQINRESAASLAITVRASSSDGSHADQAFTIAVNDVDEFDASTPTDNAGATNAVNENAAAGALVGVTANSTDGDATNHTITYSLVDNASGAFQINANTGVVSVLNGSQIDRESAASLDITVRASSSDGSHADQAFTIAVNDVDEFDASTPTDNAGATNAVNENAAAGALVGVTANSTDGDATNHTITYSLVDNASGAFQINAGTGVVTVLDGSQINRESAASLAITVRASSSDGSHADQAFTIAVNNINEAPTNTVPGAQTATEDTARVFNSGNGSQISISDVDDTNHTVTLIATNGAITLNGTSGLLFAVGDGTSDGTMTFSGTDASINAALNGLRFLGATNFNGAASIRIVTTDGVLSDTDSVAITVNAVNDGPVISSLAITSTSISFVATDPDNANLSLTSAFAAAFGNPAVISAKTTVLTPTEQTSGVVGVPSALQVTDGSATADVVNLYRGTGFGTTMVAGGSVDTAMYGFGGNDSLSAGSGADWLFGGSGNDTLFGAQNDRVLDGGTETDTLQVAANFTSTGNAQIVNTENVLLTVGVTLNLSNQTEGFAITGSSGVDSITGGSGADTIIGAQNDTLLNGSGGTDTLRVGASFTSTSNAQIANIENVTLTTAATLDLSNQTEGFNINGSSSGNTILGGSGADTINGQAGNDSLFGLGGNDFLLGGLGNDSLNGGAGADNMHGQAGDDLYFIDNVGDTVTELAGAGIDEIRSSIGTSLNFGGRLNVENLTLIGAAISGTGNGLANRIVGNNFNNSLNGLGGNDSLFGLGGNDLLLGGSGNDSLNGGTGADNMQGQAGNDTYVVDNVADIVTELAGAGIDTIQSSISTSLNFGGRLNVENLTLIGAAISGTGNGLANRIVGNSFNNSLFGLGGNDFLLGGLGNDSLNGGAGADNMQGQTGNDTYVVDNVADIVTELAGAGIDTIQSSISTSLNFGGRLNVENLTLTGAAISGTGNGLANRIVGNSFNNSLFGLGGNDFLLGGLGNDSLNGGTGADNMQGHTGNDTYVVDNVADIVTELAGAGIDTIQSSISTSLNFGGNLNVENLTLIGAAISGTGNGLANRIAGNNLNNSLFGLGGNDLLLGLGGSDLLVGGAGNDAAWGDDGNDTIHGGEGNDKIVGGSGADYIDGGLGNDSVWGDVGNDTIYGGDGDDKIIGGSGADNIDGGLGNDTVWGDDGNDVINGGGGGDRIIGATGNDTLNGGLGADTMDGDAGNDVYVVDNAGDVVNEGDGNGIDTVRSTVSFSLANAARVFGDVERLTLTGTGNVNGTGNQLANVITGNNFNNTLSGGAGNDTLRGGLGNDVISGGAGNDVFVFNTAPNAATNRDTISDFANVAGNNDSFQLEHAIFTRLGAAGALNGNFFHVGPAAADANDFIVYNRATGALFYDINGSGAGGAIQIATLNTHPVLTASDFAVI